MEAIAHAALGVVNAIGSKGYGAAIAIDLGLRVRIDVECDGFEGIVVTRGVPLRVDEGILRSATSVLSEKLGLDIKGLCVKGVTDIPYEAGLKGSSALINAIIAAALRAKGVDDSPELVARLGVLVALRAGLTITGALDDHLAVSGCGGYATKNPDTLVLHDPSVEGYVALVVPGSRSIKSVDRRVFERYRGMYMTAWRLVALMRDWWSAALVNGVATALATNVDPRPLLEASNLEGVLATGVSGKGPTLYAIGLTRKAALEAAKTLREAYGGYIVETMVKQC